MKLKIISDGTNAGTKLINEDTGEAIHLIQKLSWECNVEDMVSKVTIELLNIPVEIVSKADVELFELLPTNQYIEPLHTKSFEKEIRITSEALKGASIIPLTKIFDNQTNEMVGAVQEVKWEATPYETKAKVKRIKFDNKDW